MNDQTLIQRYHSQPGRTNVMLEHWQDAEGRSSYEVLAQEADALPRDGRVLDLACGDGGLLALLAQQGFHDLVGVDRSPEELAAARARLATRAGLFCEDARALSMPPASVEVVVCHMALMLMNPVEPVLAEVARILKPGGLFLAVINRPLHDPVYEVYRRELHRITVEAGMDRLKLSDPRVFALEGLRELFHTHPLDNERLTMRDFAVQVQATPARLWSMLGLMYDVFRLPAPFQSSLEQRLLRGWRSLTDEGGLLTCSMGMRLLTCHSHAPSM